MSKIGTQCSDNEPKLKRVMRELIDFINSKYEYHFNVMTERAEIRKLNSGGDYVEVDQRVKNDLTMKALEANVDCLDMDVNRLFHSSFIPQFNPLKDYLDRLPLWDKIDHVSELACRICHKSDWIQGFHRWLLAMVAQWKQMNSTFGNNFMPILISPQQAFHKSTFCKLILPPELRCYYTDNFSVTSKSNPIEKLAHFALINIDEMNRFGVKAMAELKNIMEMAAVDIRKPYQVGYSHLPRMASFIATSNYTDLLTDSTGLRRFLPVVLEHRIEKLDINYSQLYAQLLTELEVDTRYWSNLSEENALTVRNQAFIRRPVEESLFFSCYRLPEKDESSSLVSISEIYETMRKKSPSTMRDIKMGSFGEHLAILGVKKERKFGAGYRYRVVQQRFE
jgi:predicted P-loop ATPase